MRLATGDDAAGGAAADRGQLSPRDVAARLVRAPQCLSTLAAVRRETGSWRHVWIMAGYLFGLAYAACWITYRVTLAFTGG
ncbi:MAG: hypothetical protein WKG52_12975 [Variovorax sp.]